MRRKRGRKIGKERRRKRRRSLGKKGKKEYGK